MWFIFLLCFFVNNSFGNKTDQTKQLIQKGTPSGIHLFSYAAFLYFENTRPASCGSSLIMVQAVLTAAHCVDEMRYKRGNIKAFFGSTIPMYSKVVRKVIDFIVHPKYREKDGKLNLAVAFLESRVPLSHEIKKVPLASVDPGENVLTASAGWGKQVKGKLPDYSDRRSIVSTKQMIMTANECSEASGFKRSPKHFCTKSVRGHFYKDDSGNGLVLIKPSHILVGVLSFVANDVGIFINVFSERNWIITSCYNLYKRNCPGGRIKK